MASDSIAVWTNVVADAAAAHEDGDDEDDDGRSVADGRTPVADDTTVSVAFHSIHRKHHAPVAFAAYPGGNSSSHRNNSPDTPDVFHPGSANRKNRTRVELVRRMVFHFHATRRPIHQSFLPSSWRARWNDGDRDGVVEHVDHPSHRYTVVALVPGYPYRCSICGRGRMIACKIGSYRRLVHTRWKCSSPDIIEVVDGGSMCCALTIPVDD